MIGIGGRESWFGILWRHRKYGSLPIEVTSELPPIKVSLMPPPRATPILVSLPHPKQHIGDLTPTHAPPCTLTNERRDTTAKAMNQGGRAPPARSTTTTSTLTCRGQEADDVRSAGRIRSEVLRIHARADPARPPASLPRSDGRTHPLYSVNFAQRRSPPTWSAKNVGAPMRQLC